MKPDNVLSGTMVSHKIDAIPPGYCGSMRWGIVRKGFRDQCLFPIMTHVRRVDL